jgi:hypothetical protein
VELPKKAKKMNAKEGNVQNDKGDNYCITLVLLNFVAFNYPFPACNMEYNLYINIYICPTCVQSSVIFLLVYVVVLTL